MPSKKHRRQIIASIRQYVPQHPGVYIFYDESGNPLYIGKSVNLKQRMLSYFQQNNSSREIRIRQMIFNIADYSYQETDSELHALLLEDQLIKKLQPYYNIRQQEYLQHRYLLLTDDAYPALMMIDGFESHREGQIFGPFRDKYFVENVLNIVQQVYQVRSCTEPDPISKCYKYEIDLCKGPCRHHLAKTDYAKMIAEVVDFLNGNEKAIVEKLVRAMQKSATALNFEDAQEIKNQLTFCKKFCTRQRFIHQFKTQNLFIFENRGQKPAYIFKTGILKTEKKDDSNQMFRNLVLARNHISAADGQARFLLDRANIVYSWLKNTKNTCKYYFE